MLQTSVPTFHGEIPPSVRSCYEVRRCVSTWNSPGHSSAWCRGPWRPVTPKAWSLRTTASNKKGYLMEYINHWLYMGFTIGYYIIAIKIITNQG